jgi:phosphatidylglycerol:prolipoprotein diacylglycerol transferase
MTAPTVLPADGYAFGLFYAAGFATAWVILLYEGRRRGWPTSRWLLLVAWTTLCGVIGSKLASFAPAELLSALGAGFLPEATAKSSVGALAAGLLGACLGRRLLALPAAVHDAFALALPVGLAIGRVGCLLGGCCFGAPTHLPWAIAYPAGSHAYALHLSRGFIAPGVAHSLPVHPVQAYEMLLMGAVLAALLRARRRFRREMSLSLLYIVLQSLVRVGIEFVREGPTQPLAAGMRPLQFGLVALALGCAVALWLRERRAVAGREPAPRPALLGSVGIGVATGLLLIVLGGWFTPLELAVLSTVVAPALFLLAREIVNASRPTLRSTAAAAFIGPLIMVVSGIDGLRAFGDEDEDDYDHRVYYNISVGGALGGWQYKDTHWVLGWDYCDTYNETHTTSYVEAALAVSRTDDFRERGRLEYGLGATVDQTTGSDTSDWFLGRAFVRYDHRWFGIGLGAAAGLFHEDSTAQRAGSYRIQPAISCRLGPEDFFFTEFAFRDEPSGLRPLARVGIGYGSLQDQGVTMRVGVAFNRTATFYLNPSFAAGRHVVVSAYGGYGGKRNYHVGLGLKFSFGRGLR